LEGIKYSNHVSSLYERDDSILSRFHSHILPILLAGILISALVDGLRPRWELGFDRASFRVPAIKEDSWFGGVGSSMSVARTVDTVSWKNLDFFHEPKQRYEEFLELGDSLFPLMVDSEINT
jgi:hypothetical protein